MGSKTLVFTADGTQTMVLEGSEIHMHINDDFGVGSVALQQIVDGQLEELYATPVVPSAPKSLGIDEIFTFWPGHVLSFTLSGSTAPNVKITVGYKNEPF